LTDLSLNAQVINVADPNNSSYSIYYLPATATTNYPSPLYSPYYSCPYLQYYQNVLLSTTTGVSFFTTPLSNLFRDIIFDPGNFYNIAIALDFSRNYITSNVSWSVDSDIGTLLFYEAGLNSNSKIFVSFWKYTGTKGVGGVASVSGGDNITIGGTSVNPTVSMPIAGVATDGKFVGVNNGVLTYEDTPPSTWVGQATSDLNMYHTNQSYKILDVYSITGDETNGNSLSIQANDGVDKNTSRIEMYNSILNLRTIDNLNNFNTLVEVGYDRNFKVNGSTLAINTQLQYDFGGTLSISGGTQNIINSAGTTNSKSFTLTPASGGEITFSDLTTLSTAPVKSISAGDNIAISGTDEVPIVSMPIAGIATDGKFVGVNNGVLTYEDTPPSTWVGQAESDLSMYHTNQSYKILDVYSITGDFHNGNDFFIQYTDDSVPVNSTIYMVGGSMELYTTDTQNNYNTNMSLGIPTNFNVASNSPLGGVVMHYGFDGTFSIDGGTQNITNSAGTTNSKSLLLTDGGAGNITFQDGTIQSTAYTGGGGGGGPTDSIQYKNATGSTGSSNFTYTDAGPNGGILSLNGELDFSNNIVLGSAKSSNAIAIGYNIDGFKQGINSISIGNNYNAYNPYLSRGTINEPFYTNMGTGFGSGTVYALAIEPSTGTIVVGGNFTLYDGSVCNNILMLNPDGTINEPFYTNMGTGIGSGDGGNVRALAIEPSTGNIVVGGIFTSYDGSGCNNIIRLNPDGTINEPFYTNMGRDTGGFGGGGGYVYALAIEPSTGTIVVGGIFTSYDGSGCNNIIRLNPDGTINEPFYTNMGEGFPDGFYVLALAIEPSTGTIVVGGEFISYDGSACNNIIMLNPDGTINEPFYTNMGTGIGSGDGGNVRALAIEHITGNIVVGGTFITYDNLFCPNIIMLNPDGTINEPFYTNMGTGIGGGGGYVYALAIEPSTGTIVVGGTFSSYYEVGCNNIIMLNLDGTINEIFYTNMGGLDITWPVVYALAIEPITGNIVVGGYSYYNNILMVNTTSQPQGNFSIAIGTLASNYTSGGQANNSIVLNASGLDLSNNAAGSLTINPIRSLESATGLSTLYYDPMTSEVISAPAPATSTAGGPTDSIQYKNATGSTGSSNFTYTDAGTNGGILSLNGELDFSNNIVIGSLNNNSAVAVGYLAGSTEQGQNTVAIGKQAGLSYQGQYAVAIGQNAGNSYQGIYSVAIGQNAGNSNQRKNAIAIGQNAGQLTQQANAIAIGNRSGLFNQGSNSIAIGNGAGEFQLENGYIEMLAGPGGAQFSIAKSASLIVTAPGTFTINSASINLGGPSLTLGNSISISTFTYNGYYYISFDNGSGPGRFYVNPSVNKYFTIQHPLDPAKYLIHACLEGPEAGVYYRGTATIPADATELEITLPDYVDAFTTEFTVHITPIDEDPTAAFIILTASRVKKGKFKVYKKDLSSFLTGLARAPAQVFDYLVFAKRGEVNVEPLKTSVNVKGFGPYTWIE
jgi:hypothetical protein